MKNALLNTILDQNYESLDPYLPGCIAFLMKNGARRIWHKNGNFFEHLIGVWRILKLWGLDSIIARAGLMHSIYGNSFGTPRFFQERGQIKQLAGEECEELIFKFCRIDRQALEKGLLSCPGIKSQFSLPAIQGRKKSLVVTPRELAVFILFSLADFLEQHSSWQELALVKQLESRFTSLTGREKALLPLVAPTDSHALWPGNRSPFATRFNYLFALARPLQTLKDFIEVPVIFRPGYIDQQNQDQKTYGISLENEISARNLYRQILRHEEEHKNASEMQPDEMMARISNIVSLNPYLGEPYLLKAQLCLQDTNNPKRFKQARILASLGLERLCDWGCAWDKRISFSGWIAWGQRLLSKAENYEQPF